MNSPVAPVVTDEMVQAAVLEVDRLEKELDITNADHIALWLASSGQMSISFLACRIAEAYDRARDGELERLRAALQALHDGLAWDWRGHPVGDLPTLREIARTALEGGAV